MLCRIFVSSLLLGSLPWSLVWFSLGKWLPNVWLACGSLKKYVARVARIEPHFIDILEIAPFFCVWLDLVV